MEAPHPHGPVQVLRVTLSPLAVDRLILALARLDAGDVVRGRRLVLDVVRGWRAPEPSRR